MTSSSSDKSESVLGKLKNFSFISTGNYPYVCARVRAKRAFLLSKRCLFKAHGDGCTSDYTFSR